MSVPIKRKPLIIILAGFYGFLIIDLLLIFFIKEPAWYIGGCASTWYLMLNAIPLLMFKRFRKVVLKENRSVSEIRKILNLLIIAGTVFLIALVINLL